VISTDPPQTRLSATALTVASGDETRFEDHTGQQHTMQVQSPPAGVVCSPMSIAIPRIGSGLSDPLICSSTAKTNKQVSVKDTGYGLELVLTVKPPSYVPDGATIYQQRASDLTLDRSIVYATSVITNCARLEASAQMHTEATTCSGRRL
jgi:hypothetical protein